MKKIILTKQQVALVDDNDFEWLSQWKWCAISTRNGFYAVRRRPMGGGPTISMHVVIMGTDKMNIEVDHVDNDGLNNQRFNLRIATHAQNLRNRGKNSNNTSGYKGVTWDKERKKWAVQIMINGKHIYCGRYDDVVEAAAAHNKAAKKYHGEFAVLNVLSKEAVWGSLQ